MKLNNKEKQIVANVVKQFINNKMVAIYENEYVTFKDVCKLKYRKTNDFVIMLYFVLREIIFGMVKKEHTLNEEWKTDFANYIMEDKNYNLSIKRFRAKRKLDKIKHDF